MLPFGRADAAKFFEKVIASVARDETVLVVAKLDGRIVGSVQARPRHAAEPAASRRHQEAADAPRGARHGLGAALMQRAEAEAKARGRTLLVLDTASGDAERIYQRGGWQRVGVVPDYAMWPQGGFCDTTFFWKRI